MNQYTTYEYGQIIQLTLWKKRILLVGMVLIILLFKNQLNAQAPPQADPCGRTFLNFDGTNDYLAVDGASTINGTEGTWEAWVRKDDWTAAGYDNGVLFGNGINFVSPNSMFLSFHAVVGLHFRYGGNDAGSGAIFRATGDFSDTENFDPGSWHHIATTWKPSATAGSTDLAILVDGVQTVSATLALQIDPGATLNFGFSTEFADMNHIEAGTMAEIRTWAVAKTATEITNDMNTRLVGNETGLTGYWPIDDAVGSAAVVNQVTGGSMAILNNFNVANAWQTISGEPNLEVSTGAVVISDGATYTFEGVIENESAEVEFTITNVISSSINLTGTPIIAISGIDADNYTIDQTSTSNSLASGETTTFSVTFSPTQIGAKTAVITISNDFCDNPLVINLQGSVLGAPPQNDPCERNFLNFDGTDDFLSLSTAPINGAAGTWEAWVRKDDWSIQNDGVLFGNDNPFSANNSMYLSFHSVVGLHFRYGGSNEEDAVIAGQFTNSFVANSWHHIAVTWENVSGTTTIRMIVDGAERGVETTSLLIDPGSAITFGKGDGNGNFFEAGYMADIRTWSVAKTAAEINSTMSSRLVGNEADLTGYWPLDDDLTSTSGANLVAGGPTAVLNDFDVANAWEKFVIGLELIENGVLINNRGIYDFGKNAINSPTEKNFTISNSSDVAINFMNDPVFSLSGPDAGLFSIDEAALNASLTSGQTAIIPISFTPVSLTVSTATLTIVSDVTCGTDTYVVTLIGEGGNAPIFESSSTIDVFENQFEVTDIDANDGDGGSSDENITYSIIGGVDMSLFNINSTTGQLSFANTADFEAPNDQGGNRIYELIIEANDGTIASSQTLTISLLDIPEFVFNTSSFASRTVADVTFTLVAGSQTQQDISFDNTNKFQASFDHPIEITALNIESFPFNGGQYTAKVVDDATQDTLLTAVNTVAEYFRNLSLKIGDLYPVNNNLLVQANQSSQEMLRMDFEILPAFSSEDTVTIADGSILSVIDVNTFKPGGVGEDGITYSIENTNVDEGIDGVFFDIDPVSGALSFKQEPGGKIDADRDNNLQLIVLADDGPNVARLAMTVVLDGLAIAPLLDSIGDQMVDELATLSLTALATDEDTPTGLVYSIDATSLGKGMTIDGNTGAFSWTPSEVQDGNHTVVFSVSDGGVSDTETLIITVNEVNIEPVLAAIGNHSTDEGTELTFTISATDADLDANTLTYSLDQQSVNKGMIINRANNVVSWTPRESQNGDHTVTITVTDDGPGTLADDETFTITVNEINEPPVLTAIGDQSIAEGTEFTFTAAAMDPDLPVNTLTFSLDATSIGKGMTIDGNTGAFSWTPTAMQVGDHSVTVTITDDGAGMLSDFETFTIAVKLNQIITFNPIANRVFDDTDFDLMATGGASGNPVTYVSSDETVVTISGSTVTIVGAGTTTITASQAGNANYLAATNVMQDLTIDPADQTIVFDALANKAFGDANFDLMATGGASGNVITYVSSDESVVTISGSTATIMGVGTTTITASQAGNANYNAASPVMQDLTVDPADQMITFDELANKAFGDANFDLMATGGASGNPVTYVSSDETVATISGSTVTIIGLGTATITASQAGNTNYNAAANVMQDLTIDPADQTIIFDALVNKAFGGANFDLMATGGASGNPVTYVSSDETVATISGSTVTIIGLGTTTVTASQAGNANYNAASPVMQDLTVDPADQMITFDALNDVDVGTESFELFASSSSGLAVTYTSSDETVATISGSTVNIVGIGNTTITASQAGNANYNAATNVMQDLTVQEIWIWNGIAWNNGSAPGPTNNVRIMGNYNFNTSSVFEANDLIVDRNIILSARGTDVVLRVNGDLTNNGAITVLSSAGLITKGAITGTGLYQINVSTNFDNIVGRYSVVGSPMSDAGFDVLGANALVYGYDESVTYNPLGNEGLDRFKTPAELSQTTMKVGEGYFSAFTGNTQNLGFNQAVINYFGRNLNSGTIQVDLGYTDHPTSGTVPEEDDFEGFNLVSNPYPSNISYDDFIAENLSNNIEGSIYLWDDNGSDVARGDNADYFIVNQMGNTNSRNNAEASWNGEIEKGEGFFVKAMQPTTITFNTDMQVFKTPTAARNAVSTVNNSVSSVKLLLSGEKTSQATVVGFAKDALEGIDHLYDAILFSNGENSFYSLRDGKELGIQGLPSDHDIEIPLGFKVGESGDYTISAMVIQDLNEENEVWLLDKSLGEITDLKKNDYTFHAEAGKDENRFALLTEIFSLTTVDSELLTGIYSYSVDDELGIVFDKPRYESMKFQLMDLSGKLVHTEEVAGEHARYHINTSELSANVYLLRIITNSGVWKNRVILK